MLTLDWQVHRHDDLLLPPPSSSADSVAVICLTVATGESVCVDAISSTRPRQSPGRRTRPRAILLVEMLPEDGKCDSRLGVLGMYEASRAVEAAGRTTMERATDSERQEKTNDDGHRRKMVVACLARYLGPYHGAIRVEDGVGASTAHPHGSHRTPKIHAGGGTRLLLALGDPREGVRSPCTLTIKIETAGESFSVLPPQVW